MSVDFGAIRTALRTRALTLEVCTTGSTILAATSTAFTRSSGSFVDDGFKRGMEVTASGFSGSNDGTAVVLSVAALTLTVSAYTVAFDADVGGLAATARSLSADTAAAGRTITAGLPAMRAWENIAFAENPITPWVEEQLVPGPTRRMGVTTGGAVELREMYALHVHALADKGAEAPDAYCTALFQLFAPGQPMTLANGDTLRVRSETGPYRGQLLRRRPGFATVPFTVPLELYTQQATM